MHGIGNHDAGKTLTRMIDPIASHLGTVTAKNVEFIAPRVASSRSGGAPANGLLLVTEDSGHRTEILCAEAHWSQSVVRPRLSFIPWLAEHLAILLILVSLPDRRDKTAFAPREGNFWRHVARQSVNPVPRDPFEQALLRAGLRLLLMIAVGASLLSHPQWLLGIAAAVAVISVFRSQNILGDVQLAAALPEDREKLTDQINSALDWLLFQCDEVVIVAHSQGGYLAYMALRRRAEDGYILKRPECVSSAVSAGVVKKLVGVGSGLKPIWILQHINTGRMLTASWLSLVAITLSGIAALPILWMVVDYARFAIEFLASFGATLLIPPVSLSPEALLRMQAGYARDQLDYLWRAPWQEMGFSTFAALIIVSFALTSTASLLIRRDIARKPWPALVKPGFQGLWVEITSPHDTVGRLLFPQLDNEAHEIIEPAFGNPMLDHVSYFKPASPALWDVTRQVGLVVGRNLAAEAKHAEDGGREYLTGRNNRRRRLHVALTLGAALLASAAYLPERRPLSNLWEIGRLAFPILAIFAGFHIVSILLAAADRRYILRRLSKLPRGARLRDTVKDVRETPVTWRYFLGLALFLLWVIIATCAAAVAKSGAPQTSLIAATFVLGISFAVLLLSACAAAGYPISSLAVFAYVLLTAIAFLRALPVGAALQAGIPADFVPGILLAPILLAYAVGLSVALALTPLDSLLFDTRVTAMGRFRQRIKVMAKRVRAV